MDRLNLHDNLFSRGGSTPPPSQHYGNPTQSSSSSPSQIDSLFHNLSAPSSSQHLGPVTGSLYGNPAHATSNMSLHDDAVSSSGSAPTNHPTADRQSALLSLLGTVSNPSGSVRGPSANAPPPPPPPQPQQVPTPPGSSQRSGNSPGNDNETQGKYLLEQLMSG